MTLLVAFGYSISAGRREAEARRNAEDSRQAALAALRRSTENERRAQTALYESKLALANAAQLSHTMGQRTGSIEAIHEATRLANSLGLGESAIYDLRTRAISAFSLIDVEREQFWPKPEGRWRDAMPDANSHRFATIGPDATAILIRDGDDQSLLKRLPLPTGQTVIGGFLFSPNGKYLAARCQIGSQRDQAQVWDIDTCELILEFPVARPWDPNLRWIHSPYDFSSDSKTLAVCERRKVSLFRLSDGSRDTLTQVRAATSVCFSPDGEYLAIGTAKSVKVFQNLHDDARLWHEFSVDKPVYKMAWSTDKLLAASLFQGDKISIWRTDTKVLRSELQGCEGIVHSMAFHPNLKLLVTHGTDAVSRLWRTDNGKQILDFAVSPTHFTEDGLGIASRTGRLKLRIPDSSVLQNNGNTAGSHDTSYCFHPTRPLIIGSYGATSVAVDSKTRRILWEGEVPYRGYQFSTSGDALFCRGKSGAIWRFPVSTKLQHQEAVMTIGPGKAKVTPRTMPPKWSYTSHAEQKTPRFVTLSGHTRYVAILDRVDRIVYEFDTGRMEKVYASISSDGQFLAAGFRSGGMMIWDTLSGELLQTLPDSGSRTRPRFCPNKHLLVLSESSRYRFFKKQDAEDRVWELVHTWTYRKPIRRRARALPVAFSLDGTLVALATKGRSQRALDLLATDSFERLATLNGAGTAQLWNARISPGSDYMLAWASFGPTFQLWHLASIRQQLEELGLNWRDRSPTSPLNEELAMAPMRIIWAVDSEDRMPPD